MKSLHRITGILIAFFVVAHLANHLTALWGIETHQQAMDTLRKIYRHPVIEILLITAFLFQSISGLRLFLKLRKKPDKSRLERIKMYSGAILGLFILQHISATLGQRIWYDINTNFYFAAAVVLQKPLLFYFIPYYFAGIMAFAFHVAAIHREKVSDLVSPTAAKAHFGLILFLLFIVAILILYVFSGNLYEIRIPPGY